MTLVDVFEVLDVEVEHNIIGIRIIIQDGLCIHLEFFEVTIAGNDIAVRSLCNPLFDIDILFELLLELLCLRLLVR